MRTTKQDAKREPWLRRKIRGWHAFVVGMLHWGPLAIREIVDNWCLAIGPNRKVGGGNRVVDQELPVKLGHDTNGNAS
jgi:hypothetical protein